MTRRRTALIAIVLAVAGAHGGLRAASPAPASGVHGMVVAPEREAAEVGRAVLLRGGNAVDAAVAVAFALASTYPRAGNLGGGGFLLYRAPDGSFHALDFRETAPRALTPASFLDAAGNVDPAKSQNGGLAVAVPGSVAGLALAHARWGARPWPELLAPAIRLAEDGVIVSAKSAEVYAEENSRLAADPAARAIFTRDGAPLREGDRLVQKDLARTLRAIAEAGPKAFYEGAVARAIATSVRRSGGVMTEDDLAAYRPLSRPPLEGRYRGLRVVTFPPPSSGGIVLLQALAMLERYDLASSGPGSSLTLHRIAEALRRAFADRSRYLGDPDFVAIPVKGLLDPRYLAARAATIRDDRATRSSDVGPGSPPRDGRNTLHLSIADARGGAASLTATLNSWFGAAMVAPGTGVVLNNEVDDFSLAPGVPNQYGLVGGDPNAPFGGRRPLSSMCPTIVEDVPAASRPRLVLGSPGGPRIISAVLQTIVNVVDHGMTVQEAVDAPRIHHQWLPDQLETDPSGIPKDVVDALKARGHVVAARRFTWNVAAVGVDATGRYTGAADPRGEGVACGY